MVSQSPLALLYNDKSVLESHHCATAFRILKDNPALNMWDSLSPQQYACSVLVCELCRWQEFRSNVVELVLATDMGRHLDILAEFNTRVSAGLILQDVSKSKSDRLLIMKIALKCADISNVAREFNTYMKWSAMLTEEFFAQVRST